MKTQVLEKDGKRYVDDPENGLLELKYGLPAEVLYCRKCVISNQRPSSVIEFQNSGSGDKPTIMFDEQGICAACRYAEIKESEIDWERREAELTELCDRLRSRNGSYDCVIPGSGGKDSAFTSHLVKYRYGMNPLTVTWSPHKYTDIGWRNFQSWIHEGGFDNFLMTPNGRVHGLLTRLAFENLCHPFQPFILGQRMIGPRISSLYRIPLVFYGENQAEYGNNILENESPLMDMDFFMSEQTIDNIHISGVSAAELVKKKIVSRNDLNPYLPIAPDALRQVGTEVHYLGYYIRWDPQEVYYYASKHTGFQPNGERTEGSFSKYSSIDDKVDPLHYYTTLIKFGIGRATYDAAQEIRNKKIERDEGITLVRRFDTEFPATHFPEMLIYMGMNEEQFWEVIERYRSPHLWVRHDNEWHLRQQINFGDA